MTEIYCPGCKGARFPALSSRNCPECAKLRKKGVIKNVKRARY